MNTEQKGWRSLVDYDELLLNADGLMDDETRLLKMRSIIRKAAHDALIAYQEELVKSVAELPKALRTGRNDFTNGYKAGIADALSLIKDTK